MKCPFCRNDNDRVIDSRTSPDGSIRRRRVCNTCHRRFTTYERIEERPMHVVKKDGVRVPFERDKIRAGVEKACWKRPVSAEQIEALLVEVENEIFSKFETEVESQYLGELIMEHLRRIDQIAYVRFASVYREFQDVNDFVDVLRESRTE